MKIGSRLSITVTALFLAMTFGATRIWAVSTDGGSGSPTGDPPITEADGWVSFTFGDVGSSVVTLHLYRTGADQCDGRI